MLVYYYVLKWEKELEGQTSWPWRSKQRERGEITHINSEEIFPVFQENLETSNTACPVLWLDFMKHHQHVISHSTFLPFTDSGLRHCKWKIIVAYYCELWTQICGSFNSASASPTGPWHAICYKLHSPYQALLGFRSKGGWSQMSRYPCESTSIAWVEDACCYLLKHILTSCQREEEKGHEKRVLAHLLACPVPHFAGIWLWQHKLKGQGYKADVWHFTIKTVLLFFQRRRKSLPPLQMHRKVLLCHTHLQRVSLGSTDDTTEILSPVFTSDRTGSSWPRQAILFMTPSLLTVPPSPSLSTYPLKAVPIFMQGNII